MNKREYYKNGYGVSVIENEYSYGLELAVIVWSGEWDEENNEPKRIDHSELCYDTPITGDVVKNLTEKELIKTINDGGDNTRYHDNGYYFRVVR